MVNALKKRERERERERERVGVEGCARLGLCPSDGSRAELPN
jgi:hypothetical protein